jgi:hypothetical protein
MPTFVLFHFRTSFYPPYVGLLASLAFVPVGARPKAVQKQRLESLPGTAVFYPAFVRTISIRMEWCQVAAGVQGPLGSQ